MILKILIIAFLVSLVGYWILKIIDSRMREKAQMQREFEEIISKPVPQSPKQTGGLSGKVELLPDRTEDEHPTLDEASRINAQYRNADIARWQTMDFVIGYKINRAQNCDKSCEICSAGAGIYPKSFKWEGWHPKCLCYVTPITLPREETAHFTEKFLNGEDWKAEMAKLAKEREIKSYPENFKLWIWKHKDRLSEVVAQNGLIDFISANESAIKSILSEPCPDLCGDKNSNKDN